MSSHAFNWAPVSSTAARGVGSDSRAAQPSRERTAVFAPSWKRAAASVSPRLRGQSRAPSAPVAHSMEAAARVAVGVGPYWGSTSPIQSPVRVATRSPACFSTFSSSSAT